MRRNPWRDAAWPSNRVYVEEEHQLNAHGDESAPATFARGPLLDAPVPTRPCDRQPIRIAPFFDRDERFTRARSPGTASTSDAGVESRQLREAVERVERLEQQFRRLEAGLDAQHELIEQLETERAVAHVRVADLESHLYGGLGGALAAVAQQVAFVVVIASALATVAALGLRAGGISLPFTEPIVIAAFILGATSGALAMAIHLLR